MQALQKKSYPYWMKHLNNHEIAYLKVVEENVEKHFKNDTSGHNYDHIQRVVDLTTRLLVEGACIYTTYMIAYLHDMFDDKLDSPYANLSEVYAAWGLEKDEKFEAIEKGILSIGYKGGFEHQTRSLEADIVSDADLLDAMGAIGIGRAFYYAGSKGQPFHERSLEGVVSTNYKEYRNLKRNVLAHFEEKLLKLKNEIVTQRGKVIAVHRDEVLRRFYKQFKDELDGKK